MAAPDVCQKWLRALLGFDETRCQQTLAFAAALFVIGFVASGVSELLASARKAAR